MGARYNNLKNKLSGLGFKIVETGDIFETRTKCAEFLGVSPGMITMCLNGQVKSCKGYHIEAVEIDFDYPLTDDILYDLYEQTGVSCEWRKHPFRPNLYVSDIGIIAKNIRGRVVIKRQHMQNSGYLVVSVDDYRTRKNQNGNQLVHRLVAETFIPNPHNMEFINHIDGDKTNNCVDNLEWCTRNQNMRHAYDSGLYPTERVRIKETGEVFRSASECARAIGGTACGICDCKNGRQSKHRGYHFEFFDADDDRNHEFYGIVAIDLNTDEEAYFEDVLEASEMMGIDRGPIIQCLLRERESVGHYTFVYAGREDVLLYGNEDNKQLSWLRIGIR